MWRNKVVGALAVAAAVTYLSWPVGYLVNRVVVDHGLASDLEVPGQPFSWLFVLLDIVSGALMVAVSVVAWRAARREERWWAAVGLSGYGIFGISSIVSAAIPLSCGSTRAQLLACGVSADTYGFHDVLSVLGYLALFFSLAWSARRTWRYLKSRPLFGATITVGVLWSGSGLAFLAITLRHWPEVIAQHVLLILTSLAIALVPLVTRRQERKRTRGWTSEQRRYPGGAAGNS